MSIVLTGDKKKNLPLVAADREITTRGWADNSGIDVYRVSGIKLCFRHYQLTRGLVVWYDGAEKTFSAGASC